MPLVLKEIPKERSFLKKALATLCAQA